MNKTSDTSNIQAYRSSILHFTGAPPGSAQSKNSESKEYYAYWNDGLLVVENGHVVKVGPAEDLLTQFTNISIEHFPKGLIVPGFIDTHTHYPQMHKMAAYGNTLINWLNESIFPEEARFSDKTYADQVAAKFLDTLLENGTTTAMIFCTIHTESVNAIFEAAKQRNMRIIAGKVMMDRELYAPPYLIETPNDSFIKSQRLIEKWHNKGRAAYAVTPRFAVTSSLKQLKLAGHLLKMDPSLYLQTHLAENKEELALIASLYPDHIDYLDVYDQTGLVSDRSIFAHSIHLADREWEVIANKGAAVSFCPCSNFYLGSGVPNIKKANEYGVKVSLGTDIGAGTSPSMLATLNSAYQADHLQGEATCPLKSFYLATLGGAKALQLENEIGSFNIGSAADFVVLDLTQPKLLDDIQSRSPNLKDKLSAIRSLGDDRTILQTFVMGKPQKNI